MNQLIEQFDFAKVTYSEPDDTLCINGPRDEYKEFTTFICAYRSSLWNHIPKTTKVIFKDMMVETLDNKIGGDKWCARWLIDYFGDNFSFANCYYAHYEKTSEDGGRYIITGIVSSTDTF